MTKDNLYSYRNTLAERIQDAIENEFNPGGYPRKVVSLTPEEWAEVIASLRAGPDRAEGEECHYCGVWYPKPVSYHHSTEECHANEAASRAATAEPAAPHKE